MNQDFAKPSGVAEPMSISICRVTVQALAPEVVTPPKPAEPPAKEKP